MTTVVHVIGSLEHGGAEKVALDLVRAVPAAKVHQIFYCFSGREGVLADTFRRSNADVVAAPEGGILRRLRGLRRLVAESHADVVVSHVSLASAVVLLSVRRLTRVRIARLHSTGDGRSGALRGMYRGTARVLLPFVATHVLGVSRSALAFAVGRWSKLYAWRGVIASVLVNGVDTTRFRYLGEDSSRSRKQVVHIGRASPEKNRAKLPPIFRALTSERDDLEMRVIGPGDPGDLGAIPEDERFRVMGAVEDAAPVLQRADALVLPSVREGLPGVVLEALASGVPVVASELPTLREIDDLPGLTLVAADAAPEVWSRALLRSLESSAAERAAIAAAIADSRFTLTRNAEEWAKYWLTARSSTP